MSFVDVTLGTLTLTAGAHPAFDHLSIALNRSPEVKWIVHFYSYAFSRPHVDLPLSMLSKPECYGASIVANVYQPSGAMVIREIKAAVAAANTWYKNVHEPALAAAAARATATAPALESRQTALRAVLSEP